MGAAASISISTSTPAIQRLATYESPFKNVLKLERMLASGCDYLPGNQMDATIRVGIVSQDDPQNPLSRQAIRLGDSDTYRLKSFQESADSLQYTFEKGVSLTLMKRHDSVLYNLKTPELDVTREVYPGIVKMYKPIGMVSEELDKIGTLFQMK